MGKFSIQNQVVAKKLAIMVEGTFQLTDAQNFLTTFNKEVKALVPRQYVVSLTFLHSK